MDGVDGEATFVRQTEKLLRQVAFNTFSSIKFRSINCGGVGGGPIQQSEWLREIGLSFNPDMIVQSFFIGNDVYDDLTWQGIKISDNNIIKEPDNISKKIYKIPALKKIVFFDWLWFPIGEYSIF